MAVIVPEVIAALVRNAFSSGLSMKWCCAGFRAHYEQAGRKGTAILVGRDLLGEPEFVWQHRLFDKGTEESEMPSSVALVSDSRIQFCPWCGQNLARWYAKGVDDLTREGYRVPTRGRPAKGG
jgi:hypothetical protein